jgi:hypothetical protein
MSLEGQWADALLQFERLHLFKLALWAAMSVVAGTGILALLHLRRAESPLLQHFAIQSMAWGTVDLAIVIAAQRGLALRSYAEAVALDRFLWLNVGLDVGYVAVGATLAISGWVMGRRLGLVGAGLGVIVQGVALAILDLQLTAVVLR